MVVIIYQYKLQRCLIRVSVVMEKNEALPLCNGNGPLTEISLCGEASPNGIRLKSIRKWFVHVQQHEFSLF